MTQREKLYYLIENYHKGNYDAKSFSDQFVIIFSEGVDGYTGKKEKRLCKRFVNLPKDIRLMMKIWLYLLFLFPMTLSENYLTNCIKNILLKSVRNNIEYCNRFIPLNRCVTRAWN